MGLFLGLLLGSTQVSAWSCSSAEREDHLSADKTRVLTIVPGRIRFETHMPALARLAERSEDGREVMKWIVPLPHAEAPGHVIVSPDAKRFALLDGFCFNYRGPHIVILDDTGRIQHQLTIDDFLTEREQIAQARNMGGTWWQCRDAEFVNDRQLQLWVHRDTSVDDSCLPVMFDTVSGTFDKPQWLLPPLEAGHQTEADWVLEMLQRVAEDFAEAPPVNRAVGVGVFEVQKGLKTEAELITEVESLLDDGAELNALDSEGKTALDRAIGLRAWEVAAWLIHQGAELGQDGVVQHHHVQHLQQRPHQQDK